MTALSGVRILDLSRVLAGPFCAQLLADLGADVIKIERPVSGDDSRAWGPPYMRDRDGNASDQSVYFHAANRGKRSVTIDIAHPDGQDLVRQLAAKSDVIVENYKVGALTRYGLGYDALSALNERLIYCSITGFGQTGPYSHRPGYDTVMQGIGGLMSITGQPDQEPQRVGVAVVDVMTGLYATVGILAALNHRNASGKGQYVDLALLDVQMAALANIGMNYLATGNIPRRTGNTNPTIAPCGVFQCSDGQIMAIVGNESQFRSFCAATNMQALQTDVRFASNAARVANTDALTDILSIVFLTRTVGEWLKVLEAAGIPSGPINDVGQAFADPQVQSRNIVKALDHPTLGQVPTISNPIHLSRTPTRYERPAPLLAEHTMDILCDVLGLAPEMVNALASKKVIW